MNSSFGIERPAAHTHEEHDRPARYLVIIESGGSPVARLFLDNREPVAEFDAAADEVAMMTTGLLAEHTAQSPEWDQALAGHSAAERAAAAVYTLDV
jgi:hypothetical protein